MKSSSLKVVFYRYDSYLSTHNRERTVNEILSKEFIYLVGEKSGLLLNYTMKVKDTSAMKTTNSMWGLQTVQFITDLSGRYRTIECKMSERTCQLAGGCGACVNVSEKVKLNNFASASSAFGRCALRSAVTGVVTGCNATGRWERILIPDIRGPGLWLWCGGGVLTAALNALRQGALNIDTNSG